MLKVEPTMYGLLVQQLRRDVPRQLEPILKTSWQRFLGTSPVEGPAQERSLPLR